MALGIEWSVWSLLGQCSQMYLKAGWISKATPLHAAKDASCQHWAQLEPQWEHRAMAHDLGISHRMVVILRGGKQSLSYQLRTTPLGLERWKREAGSEQQGWV